jgi:4-hydroxy-3-methylbut-2-enyl diphosphate reductase
MLTTTATPSAKRAKAFSDDDSVEVIIAMNAGACFGVVRAIKLGLHAVSKTSEKGGAVYSLGPLIHNPMVVANMEQKGVRTIQDPSEATDGTVVLRSHGVRREIEASLRERGIHVVDATCPLVKKPQRIAQGLGAKGYFLVLVGDANHPEVKGVLSYFGKPDYIVTYDPGDVDKIPANVEKVAVLAQTTIEHAVLMAVVERCRARFAEVAVHNTICDATSVRQSEADALARQADVVIVVGGRNSSNTKKLWKICHELQPDTHLIETAEELNPEWFAGKRKIGVTGGASTPQDYVDEVGRRIAAMMSAPTA